MVRYSDHGPDRRRWVRRPDGLFDLDLVAAPGGGLAAPDRPGVALSAEDLADEVRRAGGPGSDVRIVAPVGEQDLATVVALARLLDRDVLVPPPGAEPRHVPAAGAEAVGTGQGVVEVVAVDRATGKPVDWTTVPPSGEVGRVPGWFSLVEGRVLPRTGTVALPLPGGGLMLPVREDFVRRRAAAAALRPSDSRLLTVAVGVRSGEFVVGDYDGRSVLCDGLDLASVLASLPLYGADVRMWLSWPESAQDRGQLRRRLTELAEVTGATVWAPVEYGRADLLDGGDLAAVGHDGRPAGWEPYGPVGALDFESDMDGRLVPLGGEDPGAGQPDGPAAVRGYSRSAVARALAVLDPGDPGDARRLVALTSAAATHAATVRRLEAAQGPDECERLVRQLNHTAERIDRLASGDTVDDVPIPATSPGRGAPDPAARHP